MSDTDRTCSGRSLRLMITGGGTGGHIFPGLAVADAVRILDPGADIRFVGTSGGLESILVPKSGYPLHYLPASGYRGLGVLDRLRFLLNLVGGLFGGIWLVLRHRPDIILGTGGYVSLPLMLAGRLFRRRLVLQEQNSIPGSANRLLARWCRRIYLGFADAARYFPGRETRHTGNPVRADIGGDIESLNRRPMSDGILRVLVCGGSRGARTLNRAVIDLAGHWRGRLDIELLAQTGPTERDEVHAAWRDVEFRAAKIVPFIENMPEVLAWADVVVCRAGAMTLAELACAGRPAILVPFPHATDDHQTVNARSLAEAGAATVIADGKCDGLSLGAEIESLIEGGERLAMMAESSRRLARGDAAAEIATDLLRLAHLLPERDRRS